jgi:hypothetical protein
MSSESISQSLSTVSTDSALYVARDNDELSEDQLEAVTGGAGFPGGIGSIPKPPNHQNRGWTRRARGIANKPDRGICLYFD